MVLKPRYEQVYDIEKMLQSAEYVTGILRIVYMIKNEEEYTKEEAASELMEVLKETSGCYSPIYKSVE